MFALTRAPVEVLMMLNVALPPRTERLRVVASDPHDAREVVSAGLQRDPTVTAFVVESIGVVVALGEEVTRG